MGWLTRMLGLEAAPHAVVHVTDDNYQAEVLHAALPVLLDVWSDGCGPCKLLEPVVMQLSREYHRRLKVAELNVAQAPKTARKLGVTGTPTVLYLRGGRVVERVVGYRAGHYHRDFIDRELLTRASSGG
jgi:thioredoxin-like negative regulator of GroEL